MIPTSIDGTDITGATIDGTDVTEITVDGDVVFSAGPALPTTNLIHHYDASTMSAGTDTFVDQVGTADKFSNGSPGIATKNGLNVVDYSPGDNHFAVTNDVTAPFSLFAAAKYDTNDAIGINEEELIGTNEFLYNVIVSQDSTNSLFFQDSTGQGLTYKSPQDTNWHIWGAISNASGEIRLDAVTADTGSSFPDVKDGIVMNDRQNNGRGSDSKIAEVLIYDTGNPPTSDIETYLSERWNIPI